MLNRRICCALLVGASVLLPVAYAADDTNAAADDTQLAARVSAKLSSLDPAAAPRVSVSAHDGVVTLTGRVFTQAQLVKLLQGAHGVPGVRKVKNRLSLP